MNRKEQIEDIKQRTGISETIIREVFRGTRESLIESLKRGEVYNIYGICSFTTSDRVKIDVETQSKKDYKTVQVHPSPSLKDDVNKSNEQNSTENEIELNIQDTDVITKELSILK